MHRPLLPLLCALVASPALAQMPQWGGSVTASSDYLLRGTSRNYNDPALSTEIHARSRQGWFASLWASTTRLRYGDPVTVELTGSAGFGRPFGAGWSWSASFTHYDTPWSSRAVEYRYDEFTLDVDWRGRLLLSANWSPNSARFAPDYGFARGRPAMAWEASYQHALHRALRGWAGLGYHDLSALFDGGYWYGSLGLGWTWRRWQLDVSYVVPGDAARRLSYPGAAQRRAVASLRFNF